MQFQDEGYIINLRKYGERSAIVTLVSAQHGKISGFAKNCMSKKNLGIFQIGNKVSFSGYSRVDGNMLSVQIELMSPCAINFMESPQKLSVLQAFCEMCEQSFVPFEPLADLYSYIDGFFDAAAKDNWLEQYAFFEFFLLDFLGIGLDLQKCAVTGRTDDLRYVSPKTGKAVCAEVGKQYADRLFKYPIFVRDNNQYPSEEEILELLKMTEFFLKKNFFDANGLKFPINRANLLHNLNFS